MIWFVVYVGIRLRIFAESKWQWGTRDRKRERGREWAWNKRQMWPKFDADDQRQIMNFLLWIIAATAPNHVHGAEKQKTISTRFIDQIISISFVAFVSVIFPWIQWNHFHNDCWTNANCVSNEIDFMNRSGEWILIALKIVTVQRTKRKGHHWIE